MFKVWVLRLPQRESGEVVVGLGFGVVRVLCIAEKGFVRHVIICWYIHSTEIEWPRANFCLD